MKGKAKVLLMLLAGAVSPFVGTSYYCFLDWGIDKMGWELTNDGLALGVVFSVVMTILSLFTTAAWLWGD